MNDIRYEIPLIGHRHSGQFSILSRITTIKPVQPKPGEMSAGLKRYFSLDRRRASQFGGGRQLGRRGPSESWPLLEALELSSCCCKAEERLSAV